MGFRTSGVFLGFLVISVTYDRTIPEIFNQNPFEERMVATSQTPWHPVILPSGVGTKKKSRKGRFNKNLYPLVMIWMKQP